MFSFNTLATYGPWIALAASVIGLAWLVWRRYAVSDTPVSSVHKGKKPTHECKFDRALAREFNAAYERACLLDQLRGKRPFVAQGFLGAVDIDVSNLAAPDPRVVAVLKTVQTPEIEQMLRDLSGEQDATVNGTKVRIASRNSFSKGLETAGQFVEQFYAGKDVALPTTRFKYRRGGKELFNVIAEMVCDPTLDTVLIYCGHLDSTAGRTGSPEPKAPGCDDDGTGTVGVMLTAKALVALKKAGVKFGVGKILFCHYSGEEQGLWGSYAHSDKLVKDGVNVIGVVNTDMIGYCAKPGNRLDLHDNADQNGSHALVEVYVRNIKRYNLDLNPVDTHNHAVEDRHDGASWLDHGKRAILASEEFSDDGFNPAYHSVNDRIGILNLPYMREVVCANIASAPEMSELK
jgi:hypothetical protein